MRRGRHGAPGIVRAAATPPSASPWHDRQCTPSSTFSGRNSGRSVSECGSTGSGLWQHRHSSFAKPFVDSWMFGFVQAER